MLPPYRILTEDELRQIHDASLDVLGSVGVRVFHEGILKTLADAGAAVDFTQQTVRFDESMTAEAIAAAGKRYILYGRDGTKTARLGYGDVVTLSSPGQYSWVDPIARTRRAPTSRDTFQAITVGDALDNLTIVGAMTQPVDVPTPIRDIWLTAELVKRTNKPTRCWIANGRTAHYILEIYKVVAGGAEALKERPQVEAFVEPISPLQMPATGMEILLEFVQAGLPVSYGPMVQAAATGPATLAGTLAQENAENLAAIIITQVLQPGTAVMYGGLCHIMDMRTTSISFGSPEQGLLSMAMAQLAKWYGFPVYINAGLGDSKTVDVQSGLERGMNFLMGVLAGGDLVAHLGISGADQGASLPQLVVDNEMIAFVKRILRGFEVNDQSLAVDVIKEIGYEGQHLSHLHTVSTFRKEFWLPSSLWDRDSWGPWVQHGATTMAERAAAEVDRILSTHVVPPLGEDVEREIDAIVDAARRELL